MDSEPSRKPDFSRRIRRISSIAVVIAAIYAVSVLLYRWAQNREYSAKSKEEAAAAQRAEDESSIEAMGGAQFAILNFYASPGEVRRGEAVEMCYGVANAQSVKIEPDIGRGTWPSLSRCVEVAPKKTTTYTLIAQDAHGKTKSASLTIKVH
jgi:hypothetical protein